LPHSKAEFTYNVSCINPSYLLGCNFSEHRVYNQQAPFTTHPLSPFEILFQQKPYYKFLHVLGCACYLPFRPYAQHKLESRSDKYIFLTIHHFTKDICVFTCQQNKVYVSRHVLFDELDLPFTYQHKDIHFTL
jgi:hypothetical protein